MKKFDTPILSEMNGFQMETVYAASGYIPNPSVVKAGGEWDINTRWANHNSGSHSELVINGVHAGTTSGNSVKMTFVLADGFRLDTVKDCGGYNVTNVTENGFTIERNNFFNPNDRFEFNVQVTALNSPYRGAFAKTGESAACGFVCVSYESN